ncbi:hypothetical protein ACM792_14655 [Metapseudomonas otitidis]|uniref:hypothetical protein n=1 Tax=Metapseudomonas otitidis TaxID=319939 RepID=UPI0039FBDBA8
MPTRPFLRRTQQTAREAFPEVVSLTLKVTQDICGWYTKREGDNVHVFNLDNLSPMVTCLNPDCRGGGLSLESIVRNGKAGERTYSCQGQAGRSPDDTCDNQFKIELTITRKES